MVCLGSEFKPACNGVSTTWLKLHGEGILFGILSIVLGVFFTFKVFFRVCPVCLYCWYFFWGTFFESCRHTPIIII